MKITLQFILILFALGLKATDMVQIRAAFYRAAKDEKEAASFVQALDEMGQRTPLQTGYMGMGYFLLSRYAINPLTKLDHFQKGKAMLEGAIQADRANVELRFLRLIIQNALPRFLGYYKDLNEDTGILKREVSRLNDPDLKSRIDDYFAAEK